MNSFLPSLKCQMKNKKWPVVIYSIYVLKTPPVRATGGFEKFVDYDVTLATM